MTYVHGRDETAGPLLYHEQNSAAEVKEQGEHRMQKPESVRSDRIREAAAYAVQNPDQK